MAELEADEGDTRKLKRKKVRAAFLAELLACGNISASAAVIDVHRNSVYREMKSDGRFRRNVEKALDAYKRRLLKHLEKHAEGDWRATTWTLERLWPNEYGKRDPDTVTPEMLQNSVNSMLLRILPLIPAEHQASILAAVQQQQRKPDDNAT